MDESEAENAELLSIVLNRRSAQKMKLVRDELKSSKRRQFLRFSRDREASAF
jgi:hypothetical protein